MNTDANRAHWDKRAELGETAGTQDLILRKLELKALFDAIDTKEPQRVLEIGCGRGETAISIAEHYPRFSVLGIDSSPKMICLGPRPSVLNVTLQIGDAMHPPAGPFDVVYSQRCLINLPKWEAQKQAIDAIADRLVPGGRFLMCEHSQDGLDYINHIRLAWRRPAIERPWHNQYFRNSDLDTITSMNITAIVPFSATYYFLSRILNDKLASKLGEIPRYDAEINQLALRLPADCADPRFAQGRLWIWQKPD